MQGITRTLLVVAAVLTAAAAAPAQDQVNAAQTSLYEVPPRWLIDMPTAGTLPRAYFNVGFRIYPMGGAIVSTDIGLSNRIMLGVSFGGEGLVSSAEPNWNPRIEFSGKFRIIDEQEFFPAVSVGFSSQGNGLYKDDWKRYTYKSRGFYVVVSRSFYFYNWTSGWHVGLNYSLESEVDGEKDANFFLGWDAVFKYNLGLVAEYDVAINDNRASIPKGVSDTLPDGTHNLFAGKGRGYLNFGIKWLFAESLELELLLKDLLVNRRESETLTREVRLTYVEKF